MKKILTLLVLAAAITVGAHKTQAQVGAVGPGPLRVVGFMDNPFNGVLDTSTTPLTTTSYTTIMANTQNTGYAIKSMDTIGKFVGLYQGQSGFEQLVTIIGVGDNDEFAVKIQKGTRLSLKSLNGGSIFSGKLCVQLLGM